MTIQKTLHNSQAFWLIFVPVFFFECPRRNAKNSIQLIARDVFKLSSFATLYFPLVKNVQSSFCTLGGVLVLVFASQIRKVFFVENLSSAVLSLKRTWEIENVNLRCLIHQQQHDVLLTALKQCFKLIGYFPLPIVFYWIWLALKRCPIFRKLDILPFSIGHFGVA